MSHVASVAPAFYDLMQDIWLQKLQKLLVSIVITKNQQQEQDNDEGSITNNDNNINNISAATLTSMLMHCALFTGRSHRSGHINWYHLYSLLNGSGPRDKLKYSTTNSTMATCQDLQRACVFRDEKQVKLQLILDDYDKEQTNGDDDYRYNFWCSSNVAFMYFVHNPWKTSKNYHSKSNEHTLQQDPMFLAMVGYGSVHYCKPWLWRRLEAVYFMTLPSGIDAYNSSVELE